MDSKRSMGISAGKSQQTKPRITKFMLGRTGQMTVNSLEKRGLKIPPEKTKEIVLFTARGVGGNVKLSENEKRKFRQLSNLHTFGRKGKRSLSPIPVSIEKPVIEPQPNSFNNLSDLRLFENEEGSIIKIIKSMKVLDNPEQYSVTWPKGSKLTLEQSLRLQRIQNMIIEYNQLQASSPSEEQLLQKSDDISEYIGSELGSELMKVCVREIPGFPVVAKRWKEYINRQPNAVYPENEYQSAKWSESFRDLVDIYMSLKTEEQRKMRSDLTGKDQTPAWDDAEGIFAKLLNTAVRNNTAKARNLFKKYGLDFPQPSGKSEEELLAIMEKAVLDKFSTPDAQKFIEDLLVDKHGVMKYWVAENVGRGGKINPWTIQTKFDRDN